VLEANFLTVLVSVNLAVLWNVAKLTVSPFGFLLQIASVLIHSAKPHVIFLTLPL
jgi:hypothetical protein